MESILTSIKKLLGITEEYEQFDMDIVMHINTVLSILTDMGVGPEDGFVIEDKTALWSDYIPDLTKTNLHTIKTYMFLKVRQMFDPPTSSNVVESSKEMIRELEWRILHNTEFRKTEVDN